MNVIKLKNVRNDICTLELHKICLFCVCARARQPQPVFVLSICVYTALISNTNDN